MHWRGDPSKQSLVELKLVKLSQNESWLSWHGQEKIKQGTSIDFSMERDSKEGIHFIEEIDTKKHAKCIGKGLFKRTGIAYSIKTY